MGEIGERARRATHIRGMHPYSFRSGQWALITAFDTRLEDGRPTVLVEFPDGVTDSWVLDDDAAGWEFDNRSGDPRDPAADPTQADVGTEGER